MEAFVNPLVLLRSTKPKSTTSLSRRRHRYLCASASPPSPERKKLFRALATSTTLLVGAWISPVLAEGTSGIFEKFFPRNNPTTPTPSLTIEQPKKRESTSFVTKAVKSVGAAVVRIDTERVIRGPSGIILQPNGDSDGPSVFDDPGIKKFLEEFYGKQHQENRKGNDNGASSKVPYGEPKRRLLGQGSGFITSKDGVVITNAHVVKGAEKVTVTLTDGRRFLGDVKGTDELLDLAVVKIDVSNQEKELPVAPLGKSSELQVGDWVIAVGNPVGLDNTVTVGIVSSLNRSSAEVGIPDKRMSLIQTSAPLNIGNSGGPLLNEFGEVVGINTAVRMNAEAIGFAIPIDRAKNVAKQLEKGDTIAHAYVGIQMMNVTPQVAQENNEDPNALTMIPEVEGALILRVMPKSPAAAGGLRRYDIIVGIDGRKVKNVKDAQNIVDDFQVGQTVNLKVVRGYSKNVIDIGVKTGDFAAVVANSSRGLRN